jgi:hypothetical protein
MSSTRYAEIARRTLDVLGEFGECHVIHVGNVKDLRAAIRREGRRRGQRLRTHPDPGPEPARVYVYTDHPSVEAAAYNAVMDAFIPEIIDRALRPGGDAQERVFDRSVRTVDAEWT